MKVLDALVQSRIHVGESGLSRIFDPDEKGFIPLRRHTGSPDYSHIDSQPGSSCCSAIAVAALKLSDLFAFIRRFLFSPSLWCA